MITKLTKFSLCPNCGSTLYRKDYPVAGQKTCDICKNQIVEIKLKHIQSDEEFLDNCPFCGKEGEEDDTLFEEDDIIIFKCKQCKRLDGYRFIDEDDNQIYSTWDFEDLTDGNYDPLQVKIASKEGGYVFSAAKAKEIAKALKEKEKDPKEKCKRQLHQLVKQNTEALKTAGISDDLIKRTECDVGLYIYKEGELTDKQLKNLFCATLYVFHDVMVRSGRKTNSNLTERTLQKVFNVDRKTVRKWKNIVKERIKPPRLNGVTVHKENSLNPYVVVEVQEVKDITKLEKPQKGKCDYFQRDDILTHRITYFNGSWSDVCESCAEWIKLSVCEYYWTRKFSA